MDAEQKIEKLWEESPYHANNLNALANMLGLSPTELYEGNLRDTVVAGVEALKELENICSSNK